MNKRYGLVGDCFRIPTDKEDWQEIKRQPIAQPVFRPPDDIPQFLQEDYDRVNDVLDNYQRTYRRNRRRAWWHTPFIAGAGLAAGYLLHNQYFRPRQRHWLDVQ